MIGVVKCQQGDQIPSSSRYRSGTLVWSRADRIDMYLRGAMRALIGHRLAETRDASA